MPRGAEITLEPSGMLPLSGQLSNADLFEEFRRRYLGPVALEMEFLGLRLLVRDE